MKNEILHKMDVSYSDIRAFIEDIGERYKGKPAYSYRRNPRDKEIVRVNYEDLREDVRALSTMLIARGCAGKHIALIGRLSYSWVLMYFSVLAVNAVLVPLDRDWTSADLVETVKRAEIDFCFCDADMGEKSKALAEAIPELPEIVYLDGTEGETVPRLVRDGHVRLSSGDRSYYETEIDPLKLSLLVFTSGTTGKGKGVMLSQNAIITDLLDVVQYIDFSEKTIGLLPPHHTYGSSVSIFGHALIGTEVYISSGLRYILNEMKEQQPGHLVLVPLYLETFYRKILAGIKDQGKEKLFMRMMKISNGMRKVGIDMRRKFFGSVLKNFGGNLHLVVSGGAGISPEIQFFFESIGVQVLNGYGITECAPLISVNHSRNVIPGSVGAPIEVDTVKIADPNEDGEGEICVKGPNVMIGYFKDEEATAAAFDEEGYFRTGDYGRLDENGIIFITGRKKNLIILSNGKNVYPEEIESEFASVPGVQDVVVYEGQSKRGMMYNAIVLEIYPDKDYIEKNGITDLNAHFEPFVQAYNRRAVPYKKIGLLRVREEEFPKNTLRKIMRFKMDMTID